MEARLSQKKGPSALQISPVPKDRARDLTAAMEILPRSAALPRAVTWSWMELSPSLLALPCLKCLCKGGGGGGGGRGWAMMDHDPGGTSPLPSFSPCHRTTTPTRTRTGLTPQDRTIREITRGRGGPLRVTGRSVRALLGPTAS